MLTRRHFFTGSALTLLSARLASPQHASDPETPRPDVAAIDRDHILATANHALTLRPTNDLTSGAIPALTAASVLLRAPNTIRDPYAIQGPAEAQPFAEQAASRLRALLITPETRLNNELAETNHPEDLLPLAPLAEIAQSIPFLAAQPDLLSPTDLTALKTWFAQLLASLNSSRTAGLARDQKNHIGGVWLLVAAAGARAAADDNALIALRHHFETVSLRAQILADGTFPHELTSRTPYRNSLFALDLLAAAAELLSTKFESLWTYELQDGPGLRTAIAKHAPWIANRATWPYAADQTQGQAHFNDLPCRRPCLLLAARAYSQAEYATIWRTLTPPEPSSPELIAAFPLRQPLLWTTRPHP